MLFKHNYNLRHCSAISLTVVMLSVCTKRVCVCDKELVCKAVRLAFSCQTSDISIPFILISCKWVYVQSIAIFVFNSCSQQLARSLIENRFVSLDILCKPCLILFMNFASLEHLALRQWEPLNSRIHVVDSENH